MPFATISGAAEKPASLTLCRECGIEMKCPTCEFGTAHFDGLEYSGFNEQASESGSTLAQYLMQNMQMRTEEDFSDAATIGDTVSAVQLISTLFEVAAAMASFEQPGISEEERHRLHVLHRHAVEGINLIDPGNER